MEESSLPRIKRPYRFHRRSYKYITPRIYRNWLKSRPPRGTNAHISTLERGIKIIDEAKKGLTLDQIGKNMGVSRQRVYQYLEMASLKGAMSMVYQKRNARKRSIKLKKRIKKCQWCGKEFFYIHTVTFRDYCSIYCRKKYIKHRNRLKTARRMNNPNYKLKVIARGRIKAKLDK